VTEGTEKLQKLLTDADVPWGHYSGGKGQRIVYVDDLLRLARQGDVAADEDQLDHLVRGIGGVKETHIVDLQDIPRNLWRRLRHRPQKYSRPSYIFPA
jgi:hypothetical protein